MNVVINELEVIAAPEAASPGTPTRPAEPLAAGPTPFEMRAVLRHLADRADRGRAD